MGTIFKVFLYVLQTIFSPPVLAVGLGFLAWLYKRRHEFLVDELHNQSSSLASIIASAEGFAQASIEGLVEVMGAPQEKNEAAPTNGMPITADVIKKLQLRIGDKSRISDDGFREKVHQILITSTDPELTTMVNALYNAVRSLELSFSMSAFNSARFMTDAKDCLEKAYKYHKESQVIFKKKRDDIYTLKLKGTKM